MAAELLSKAEELQQAFRSFEAVSRELTRSYRSLEHRVGFLTRADAAAAALRFEAVVRALPGGVVVLDADGRIERFNAAAVELLGPLERGGSWRAVVADRVAPRWDDGHDLTLASGRRVHMATAPLPDMAGQVLLLTDVTETRRLQAQLERYRRIAAEGEMAAALAHQIRTPLAAAMLHAANLAGARLDAERRRAHADRLLERLRHLERLVEDMLLYARCGAFEREPLEVAALCEALLRAAEPQTRDGRFRIELAGETAALALEVNRDALVSALHNLVANAHEACGGQGRLRLMVRGDAERVELRFEDDGPGVDPADAETIFEPFVSGRCGGSGLGLAVARAVVRAHGGEVSLDASHARGACFVVRLPRRADAGTQTEGAMSR